MKYNLEDEVELRRFNRRVNNSIELKRIVELTIPKEKTAEQLRSDRQNRALHLFFTFITNELNELGKEFIYDGIKGMKLSCRYTDFIVKELLWKPIQITMYGFESTTELDTKAMNEIIDVILKYFAEQGIELEFPSIESLIKK